MAWYLVIMTTRPTLHMIIGPVHSSTSSTPWGADSLCGRNPFMKVAKIIVLHFLSTHFNWLSLFKKVGGAPPLYHEQFIIIARLTRFEQLRTHTQREMDSWHHV